MMNLNLLKAFPTGLKEQLCRGRHRIKCPRLRLAALARPWINALSRIKTVLLFGCWGTFLRKLMK